MRILVTNDDGVQSPGLYALALMLRDKDFDVVVAAPSGEASGSGAAITGSEVDGKISVERREIAELPGITVFSIAATPAFITLIATRGAFGAPPDVVCSGINRGANVGRAIIHSGTVGAVLTGWTYGCSGLAVSLDVGLNPREDPQWTVAAELAGELLPSILNRSEPVALNLNVPDRERDGVLGIREAPLSSFGAVQTQFEAGDGFLQMTISEQESKYEEGTDAALLANGYAPVTAIRAVTEAQVELGLRTPRS
ncbi:5'/3'-nucleotidase SurE [Catelliglobosispora koreensis]|uniref:5'/3'-nucleotidase SurE n=1 Tax=Catelliglobosispora koreensis TaxID=129052 RepID=UPI00035C80FA|nr:5'/3'-nucleotidase SurE [Catelliglobosispora koreensis]